VKVSFLTTSVFLVAPGTIDRPGRRATVVDVRWTRGGSFDG
jgi:hypothetical protein